MKATTSLGDRAIVIGAGVGGLFAAGALCPHFREVVVVEKDELPQGASFRKGVPQGPHGHILLKRGENIAEAFFPGFGKSLRAAGGVDLNMGRDIGRYAFDQWNKPVRSDIRVSSQTRPLLEYVLREALSSNSNVTIREQTKFAELILDERTVRGLVVEDRVGTPSRIEADLVIDASGRGTSTPRWLQDHGFGTVQTEQIGINLCYVTGIFETDSFEDGNPKLCTIGQTPPMVRGGSALPVEGTCWMITLSGRGDDVPSTDMSEFMAFAESLPQPCIYERIAGGRLVGSLRQFKTPESFRRQYDLLPEFPDGFLPIGDAVAGFNPIFGQGMSVAAVDAEQLAQILETRAKSGANLHGLHEGFLKGVSEAVAEAWEGTAVFDFLYDSTQGTRPDDYPSRRAIFMAMQEMADEDEDMRLRQLEVGNMLAPRASLFTVDTLAQLQERLRELWGS